MIDELLMNEINVPDDNCAVLLSGGVDSISVGFAAQRLGKKVHAYSFCLDTHPSYDFQKAKKIAEIFHWPFTGIEVPTKNLADDWHRLVQLDCRKKTHFECVYPFLYVYPEIQEDVVLSGWAADGYYGISKKAMIHYGPGKSKEKFDEFRDNYFDINNQAGYLWHELIARNNKKQLITPYLSLPVKDFFYGKTWEEVNKPFQKHHVRNAFDEFKKIGKIKNHLNLQIDSGIVNLFESLLPNKEINFKNRSRIMDVCRDWHVLNTIKANSNTLEEFLI